MWVFATWQEDNLFFGGARRFFLILDELLTPWRLEFSYCFKILELEFFYEINKRLLIDSFGEVEGSIVKLP